MNLCRKYHPNRTMGKCSEIGGMILGEQGGAEGGGKFRAWEEKFRKKYANVTNTIPKLILSIQTGVWSSDRHDICYVKRICLLPLLLIVRPGLRPRQTPAPAKRLPRPGGVCRGLPIFIREGATQEQ